MESNRQTFMVLRTLLKWVGGFLLVITLLIVLIIAFFNWNWLRGPIERMATEKTGRQLVINGDLSAHLAWPHPSFRAERITFANPPWAKEKQMVAVDGVEFTIDLPALLMKNVVLPEVRLERPVVFLEQTADGRKNWLLDRDQKDEDSRIHIDHILLDNGRFSYDDPVKKISIQSEISTQGQKDGLAKASIVFNAKGQYQGLPLAVHGTGGPVLALRDEAMPYPLKIDATIGHTAAQADGTITGLTKISAIDLNLVLRGDSLADLFPLIGIVLPETPAYSTKGRLMHSARKWRYENFGGKTGKSDIAGTLQVDTGGKRPFMQGELVSTILDLADLGPLIGAKQGSLAEAAKQPAPSPGQTAISAKARVLPDEPFNTDRWSTMDADVKLRAKSIHRAKALPIEDLVVHLKLQDSVLTLNPLNFGLAGGDLVAVVSLDGQKDPIRAQAKVQAKKLLLGKLFPTVDLSGSSIGQINGAFDLTGEGNSVAHMLATSNGKLGLVIAGGEISNEMVEIIGLDLWEWLRFKVKGDEPTQIRCGVADFSVKNGVMATNALVLDTMDTNIRGTGTIDFGKETLDLTLNPQPKDKSPVSLRGPIHIRGTLGKPEVQLDKVNLAKRGLGAILLGVINPLLALIPLIETGPGLDSDCGRLIQKAQEPAPHKTAVGSKREAKP
ncbi:MAG: AsmA family protein [Candidatus Nitrotoga sp.]|nr:AsmA family protein [Candidatus Nitrotoga sp.]MDP1854756.1 AsmA family protein [Candidatus Nitrotoga sp.]